MGKIVLKQEFITVKLADGRDENVALLRNENLSKFNANLLGLGDMGDISKPSTQIDAIAATFDLSGFTKFCSQIDPHLCVPEYLSRFLTWLFDEIRDEFINESYPQGKTLRADLPFLAKFLGDGVLFLWDTELMGPTEMGNVVISLSNICQNYRGRFYPNIRKVVVDPPHSVRCGIARGKVFSVGNGEDYVGPCINIASRLQKLSLLTFCISRRGFDFQSCMSKERYDDYALKSVPLRGIGDEELVWVIKEEFNKLPTEEKAFFSDP